VTKSTEVQGAGSGIAWQHAAPLESVPGTWSWCSRGHRSESATSALAICSFPHSAPRRSNAMLATTSTRTAR